LLLIQNKASGCQCRTLTYYAVVWPHMVVEATAACCTCATTHLVPLLVFIHSCHTCSRSASEQRQPISNATHHTNTAVALSCVQGPLIAGVSWTPCTQLTKWPQQALCSIQLQALLSTVLMSTASEHCQCETLPAGHECGAGSTASEGWTGSRATTHAGHLQI
jgi:hypothetical protein